MAQAGLELKVVLCFSLPNAGIGKWKQSINLELPVLD